MTSRARCLALGWRVNVDPRAHLYARRASSRGWTVPGAVPTTLSRRHAVPAPTPPRTTLRKPAIVCFSIIEWDLYYQWPQQILARLAESGHRVFCLSHSFLDLARSVSALGYRVRPTEAACVEGVEAAPARARR